MKILFLQIKGKTYGGVWQVNKTVGEALIRDGIDVTILSIMENKNTYEPVFDKRMHVVTLDKESIWETYSWSEIISDLKHFRLNKAFKSIHNFLASSETDFNNVISSHCTKSNAHFIGQTIHFATVFGSNHSFTIQKKKSNNDLSKRRAFIYSLLENSS